VKKQLESIKYNFIIYETSIDESIKHSIDEIKEAINKPDLKHIKYRGQHKNAPINIQDISYTGSGSSLTLIRDYFRVRDKKHYRESEIFKIDILEQGYKTEKEINMAEAQAISEMVDIDEVVKDVTLNGNNGIGVNENMEEAPYGTHEDGTIVGQAGQGPSRPDEPSVQFNSRHFSGVPEDARFAGYDKYWFDTKLKEAQVINPQIRTGGDFIIMLTEYFDSTSGTAPARRPSRSSNIDSSSLQAVAQAHLILVKELIGVE
tara:strand:- start:615 stop:1397 length:783 start_codon:yes stop_codon:yes gene_type:complete